MMKRKIILMLIFLALVCGYIFRYYSLNNTLGVKSENTIIVYETNEYVKFENNKSAFNIDYSGFEAKIINSRVLDIKEYLKDIDAENVNFNNHIPEKIVEIELCIHNTETQMNPIRINNFEVVGSDWYTRLNSELTIYANPVFLENDVNYKDLGITIVPEGYYTLKLVYNIFEEFFSKNKFDNINEEPMYFELTIHPENKFIRFR